LANQTSGFLMFQGIAKLFSEAAKNSASEKDFVDTLLVLGFPNELNEQLKTVSETHFFIYNLKAFLGTQARD
jgi:hypothetical protein